MKQKCPYPVIVDPSHATGHSALVIPMARAAIAAGCDGLMLEIHPDPANALCDGNESLSLETFRAFMVEIRADKERRHIYVS